LHAELELAQTYVDRCVEMHALGKLTADMAPGAKLSSSEFEWRMVDRGLQLHGRAGYMQESESFRRFEDARISRIYGGTTEIMKETIARSVFNA
jgi:acyl-CoA dehydrogenase